MSRTNLTAPVTHQVQGLQKMESFSATPVPSNGTQKIFPAYRRQGFQAVSKWWFTDLMGVSQPLVAHSVGGQESDELFELGWNG